MKPIDRTRSPRCGEQVIRVSQCATHDIRSGSRRKHRRHLSYLITKFNEFVCLHLLQVQMDFLMFDDCHQRSRVMIREILECLKNTRTIVIIAEAQAPE
ncbi:hypothetical protein WL14_05310 [Burkholderia cepacia]|nr:hypothetical protein WJ46_20150 [Burkholderia cepacia]KVQ34347.1 hypothetical protein WK02_00375 [Burkholderia cepacia]KVZ28206.1 hypothetical protein WL14_05310 [Burkholderia cepacia]